MQLFRVQTQIAVGYYSNDQSLSAASGPLGEIFRVNTQKYSEYYMGEIFRVTSIYGKIEQVANK